MSLVIRCHAGRLRLRIVCDACGDIIGALTDGVAISAETRGGDEVRDVRHAHQVPSCLAAVQGPVLAIGDLPRRQPLGNHLAGVGDVARRWPRTDSPLNPVEAFKLGGPEVEDGEGGGASDREVSDDDNYDDAA